MLRVKHSIASKYDPTFRFQVTELLGQGTYGKVFKVTDTNGKQFAIKSFQDEDGEPHETTVAECVILNSLSHPNIIKPIKIMVEDHSCMMLMDMMDGDLSKLARKYAIAAAGRGGTNTIKPETHAQPSPIKAVGLPKEVLRTVMYQSFLAMAYMHDHKIFHRDIKPQNILYKETVDGNIDIKFADLGLATNFAPTADASFAYGTHVQTMWYRCPEILLGTTTYYPVVDMWSMGCLIVEMATGLPMFPGENTFDQVCLIFQLLGTPTEETWPGCTKTLKYLHASMPRWPGNMSVLRSPAILNKLGDDGIDLVQRLLTYDPKKRISAHVALKHPWFASLRNPDTLAPAAESVSMEDVDI